MKRSPFSTVSMNPFCATITPRRLACVDCTKTLFTTSSRSESLSTKKTRSAWRDSRKTPGVTAETSSRLSSRRRYSRLCASDHGDTASESTPQTSARGSAKRSTGFTHAAMERPDVNHTVISLSRKLLVSVSSTATKAAIDSSTGM